MTVTRHLFALLCRRICVLLAFGMATGAAMAEPLRVDASPAVPLWSAVTLLADPGHTYTAQQLIGQAARFEPPGGTVNNLGRRAETMWLRVPLVVVGAQPQRRVFEIDYPPLNQVDLYLLQDGQVQSHQRMGNQVGAAERAMATRTHAAPLVLAPGEQELLLRVQTLSSVVLPMTLRTPEDFTRYESQVQLVQGVLVGLALCMLLYSLAHWVSLRDPVFLDYTLLLLGNTLFSLAYFGIGAQYLWADWPRLSLLAAPVGIMLAVFAGTRFARSTLAVHEVSRSVDLMLRTAGIAAVVGTLCILLGVLGYRSSQTLVTLLGLAVTCAVLPIAAVRARRGERVAGYMLIGWAVYSIGALTMAGLLRGFVEPTFWSQHVYPFSTMVEMSAWMAVLGLRVQAIHSNADRARVESETLRTMAHTDALTGLPNRRGLHDHLGPALRNASADRMLAVFLMDLDGFKPVNDRYGHDVGDALLAAVGKRLTTQLRGQDVVARLGGDEFVVLASGLGDEAAALALGQKLLASFDEPFDAGGQRCEIGLTIGYALAPLDGQSADELLKRADAAMYAGKERGRRCLQRGGRAIVSVSSSVA